MSGDRLTHRTHADLLDQVTDDEAEKRNVRRILGAPLPLREEDLDAHQRYLLAPFPVAPANHAHRYSACRSGPCQQGRKLCPSPEACQLDAAAAGARPPRRRDTLRTFALAAAGVAGIGLVLGAVAAAALAAAGVLLP